MSLSKQKGEWEIPNDKARQQIVAIALLKKLFYSYQSNECAKISLSFSEEECIKAMQELPSTCSCYL